MSKTISPFKLLPSTLLDIPTLSHISAIAFQSDTHTRLKSQSVGKPLAHSDEMAPVLEMWMSSPNCMILKAISSTGQILGWACWAFKGFEDGVDPFPSAEREKGEGRLDEHVTKEKREDEPTNKKPPKLQQLEHLTNTSMNHYFNILSPPQVPHLILVAIAIHPSHQFHGVGSSLINWGTTIADKRGVYCWVSSSDGGYQVFEKAGFKEVGRLELDLDEFAEEGVKNEESVNGQGNWGFYVWRWMKREAGGAL